MITYVDVHELDPGEAEIDGELSVIVVLDTGHMYGTSFCARPPGALLH